MNNYEHLSLLLDKTLESQQKLLELEIRKTDILIRGSAQELDEILILEQPLIMNTARMEQRREALQKEMGLEGVTLREITENYDPENIYGFKGHFQTLSKVLQRLKKTNQLNMGILNSQLSLLNQIMIISGLKKSSLTYKKSQPSRTETTEKKGVL
ncbi:MAG: flagellar protein FlgN [Bacillota bacterium]|jgi:flagellar biosynthesis/type III secretory pathway chaperone